MGSYLLSCSFTGYRPGFFRKREWKDFCTHSSSLCLLPLTSCGGQSFQMKALSLHLRLPLDTGHIHSWGTDSEETPSAHRVIFPPVNGARGCCVSNGCSINSPSFLPTNVDCENVWSHIPHSGIRSHYNRLDRTDETAACKKIKMKGEASLSEYNCLFTPNECCRQPFTSLARFFNSLEEKSASHSLFYLRLKMVKYCLFHGTDECFSDYDCT